MPNDVGGIACQHRGEPILADQTGKRCQVCCQAFHIQCLRSTTRKNVYCVKFAPPEMNLDGDERTPTNGGLLTGTPLSAGKPAAEDDQTPTNPHQPIEANSRISFANYGRPLSSTVREEQTEMEAMRQQMAMMQEALISIQLALGAGGRERSETGSGDNGRGGQRQTEQSVGEQSRDNSSEESRTLNATQSRILKSIKVQPVTKAELEYIRASGDLPKFAGDPTTWFVFHATYQESTLQCG